jgi:hypothetical protein
VCRLYERDWKRKPKLAELIGTIEAVLEAQLEDHTSDGDTNEIDSITCKTRKRPKRQKFAKGDVLMARLENGQSIYARVFDVDEAMGPMVGVYDSQGMSRLDLLSIVECSLAVKISPIHREILQDREWIVIGNREITVEDKKLPRGPLAIAGDNLQLEAANYFYGLCKKPFYDVNDWLARPKSRHRKKKTKR